MQQFTKRIIITLLALGLLALPTISQMAAADHNPPQQIAAADGDTWCPGC